MYNNVTVLHKLKSIIVRVSVFLIITCNILYNNKI